MSFEWNDAELRLDVRANTRKNLTAAAGVLATDVKSALNVMGRSKETITTKSGKTRTKLGKKGEVVSQPGEAPRRQSGRLWRSVKKRVKGMKARVSAAGNLFEFGTKHMAPRPFLRTTLEKDKNKLADILTTPLP